jgi:heparin/heparan-sulfate lyase
MFTAGGDVTMHRHYDENNFVIYRKGFLALDSGSRAYQTDHNLTYYYSQTVAHNCMLVHKPKEPLPGYWGVKYSGEEGKYSYGGQGFQKASVLAFETKPGFTYIASDATKSYSGKCSEAIRQFLWVSPDLFVVYDRVETLEPTYAKEWLLHTANEPEITASLSRASAGESVMYLQTILPENALIRKVGGKGKEFWSAGRNWELAPEFVSDSRRRCEKDGHGPWFGQWRLEVAPSKLEKSNRFLNVINVGDVTSCRPLSCQLLRHANMEGVKIRLEPNKAKGEAAYVELSVLFNCGGKVGGNLHVRKIDNTGKLLREKKYVFTQDVAPQSGVENDF